MSRNPNRLLALVLLCGLAPVALKADEPVRTGADSAQSAKVEPKTGKTRDTLLYVRTDPPGATVFLNGKKLGTTNGLFPVKPGSGTILLELEGHEAGRRPVIVRANGITRLELNLAPKAEAGAAGHAVEQPAAAKKAKFVLVPVEQPAAAGKARVFLGPRAFAKGDKIEIQEVCSERGTLAKGDTVTVKGTCTLHSQSAATLWFYITTDAALGTQPGTPVSKEIAAGTVSFEMKRRIDCPGHLHLGLYDHQTGECLGTVYFGTEAQMKEIADWQKGWVDQISRPKDEGKPEKQE